MTREDYDLYCKALPYTTHVVQWGDASVWKIGGKVFAIGGWNEDEDFFAVTFKCTPLSFDILKEQPGCRPAPYLASRGFKWIQRIGDEAMSDEDLKDYIKGSYDLVMSGLPKKKQREFGAIV